MYFCKQNVYHSCTQSDKSALHRTSNKQHVSIEATRKKNATNNKNNIADTTAMAKS